MQSPGELLRERIITIASQPVTGLNAEFVKECAARKLRVPLPANATDQTAPFNFTGQNSATFFRMKEEISWLEANSEQQYPSLVICALSANQDTRRIDGVKFFGDVTTEIRAYIAWPVTEPPANNNFEAHLDALEQAFITCLNRDIAAFAPALYRNMLSFPQRLPLAVCNNDQLLRRGLVAHVTAKVYQF